MSGSLVSRGYNPLSQIDDVWFPQQPPTPLSDPDAMAVAQFFRLTHQHGVNPNGNKQIVEHCRFLRFDLRPLEQNEELCDCLYDVARFSTVKFRKICGKSLPYIFTSQYLPTKPRTRRNLVKAFATYRQLWERYNKIRLWYSEDERSTNYVAFHDLEKYFQTYEIMVD